MSNSQVNFANGLPQNYSRTRIIGMIYAIKNRAKWRDFVAVMTNEIN